MHVKKTLYYKNLHLNQLDEEEYEYLISIGMLYVFFPEATGIMKNDLSRVDVIGQNGNDGLHYEEPEEGNPCVHYRVPKSDNPDGVDWPHKWEDGYAEKIEKLYNVNSEEEYIPPKDGMFEEPDYEANESCRGHDMISNPSHYEIGNTGLEAIDVIEATLTKEEYIGYLRGNLLKYHLRAHKKNGTEDLRKADVYSGWLVEELEGD